MSNQFESDDAALSDVETGSRKRIMAYARRNKSSLSRRTAVQMKILKLGLSIHNIRVRAPDGVEKLCVFSSIPNEIADFDIDESISQTTRLIKNKTSTKTQDSRLSSAYK